MTEFTVGQGQDVTAETGQGNVYDVLDGGVLQIAPQLSPDIDTVINLQGGAGLVIQPQFQGLDLSGVHFSGVGNVIAFEDAANISSGVFANQPLDLSQSGFGSTDGFVVPGNNSISAETYTASTGDLMLTINGVNRYILLPTGLDPVDFHVASGDNVTGIAYVACFARGTRIATVAGEVAVEDLAVGTEVTLARGGQARIAWIGRRRMRPATHPNPQSVQPVAFAPGAIAPNVPARELLVSPDHALVFDDVLIPAGLLVNGRTVRRVEVASVDYFHVELDRHDILLAEGAAAESYLDTGNRGIFANASITMLNADLAAIPADVAHAAGLCAEMVLSGPRLDAVRAGLDARADRLETQPGLRAAG